MEIKEYSIKKGDLEVKFLNLGAVITEINYKHINRVIKFEKLSAYLENSMYLGAVVGRTAGRIKNGQFSDGQLSRNFLNKHNLHGNGMHIKFYDVKLIDQSTAVLSVVDPEGDYPGNLNLELKYSIDNNSLHQEITGSCDKPTLINMTNHTYFNLNGNGTILDHQLQINSQRVGVLNDEMLTVDLIDVDGSAFDFNQHRVIRDALDQGDKQFAITGFIDHPFELNGNMELIGNDCSMVVETNQPYVVGYFGSQISNETNLFKNNQITNYAGLCLETQKCPGDIQLISDYYSSTKFIFR